MRNNRTITAFLLCLLSVIVASAFTRLHSMGQQAGAVRGGGQSLRRKMGAVKNKQEWDELLSKLPAAGYNAPEPDDPEAREKRRVKNSHYDKRSLVVRNPDTSINLTEVTYEGNERWPLPTEQSDAVVVGNVRDRQSYLSNDKYGVYTEFTVSVDDVLKGNPARIHKGDMITALRQGGVVQYPNGYKRLYLVSGEGLPLDSGQYLMFLKSDGRNENYFILTMYQLDAEDVTPVDEGAQFEPYVGLKKADFLRTVQDKIANSSQPLPEKD